MKANAIELSDVGVVREGCAILAGVRLTVPKVPETSQRHERQCSQYSLCVKKVRSDGSLESYVFADHEKAINAPGFVIDNGEDRDVSDARNAVAKYTIASSPSSKSRGPRLALWPQMAYPR